jgi:hypothetical protein
MRRARGSPLLASATVRRLVSALSLLGFLGVLLRFDFLLVAAASSGHEPHLLVDSIRLGPAWPFDVGSDSPPAGDLLPGMRPIATNGGKEKRRQSAGGKAHHRGCGKPDALAAHNRVTPSRAAANLGIALARPQGILPVGARGRRRQRRGWRGARDSWPGGRFGGPKKAREIWNNSVGIGSAAAFQGR